MNWKIMLRVGMVTGIGVSDGFSLLDFSNLSYCGYDIRLRVG